MCCQVFCCYLFELHSPPSLCFICHLKLKDESPDVEQSDSLLSMSRHRVPGHSGGEGSHLRETEESEAQLWSLEGQESHPVLFDDVR